MLSHGIGLADRTPLLGRGLYGARGSNRETALEHGELVDGEAIPCLRPWRRAEMDSEDEAE